jgi:hypothetical protein
LQNSILVGEFKMQFSAGTQKYRNFYSVVRKLTNANLTHCRLGGVVVSVLATGPKVCGFEPGQGDGFFKKLKSATHLPFGWEVKPEFPYRKILQHVKELLKSHGDD